MQGKDPEFYTFLKQQDADLLHFDDDELSDDEESVDIELAESGDDQFDDEEIKAEREIVNEAEESRRLRKVSDKKGKMVKSLEEKIMEKCESDDEGEEGDEDEDETDSKKVSLTKQMLVSWEQDLSVN